MEGRIIMSKINRIKCGNGNCYIVWNEDSAILVDTGKREYADRVIEACKPYNIKLIVLTHGHFDHAESAAQISDALGVPIGMNEGDLNLIISNENQALCAKTLLGKIVLSASVKDFKRRTIPPFKPDVTLRDGDTLGDFGINARIIGLAGHTDGSIGIDIDNKHLIAGDALMNMFYPTVSMIFHNKDDMMKSAAKIGGLGDRTIYFGHGKPVSNRQWVK